MLFRSASGCTHRHLPIPSHFCVLQLDVNFPEIWCRRAALAHEGCVGGKKLWQRLATLGVAKCTVLAAADTLCQWPVRFNFQDCCGFLLQYTLWAGIRCCQDLLREFAACWFEFLALRSLKKWPGEFKKEARGE